MKLSELFHPDELNCISCLWQWRAPKSPMNICITIMNQRRAGFNFMYDTVIVWDLARMSNDWSYEASYKAE